MNSLELEFLFSINFSLHVPADLYEKYNMELYNHVARPSVPCGCRTYATVVANRGWWICLVPIV